MAKVKIKVPYQAFACPECNSEVKPNQETFCNNCGVNLKLYKKIEKKTFYQIKEYEDWEICPQCKEPSVSKQYHEWTEHDNNRSCMGYFCYDTCWKWVYTCRKCSYHWETKIFRNHNEGSVEDSYR